MHNLFILMLFCISSLAYAIDIESLKSVLSEEDCFFDYPLNLQIVSGCTRQANVMLCCHGYGGNGQRLIGKINEMQVVPDHLVGFNFPDYGITYSSDHSNTKFGSIDELLPALYILKKITVDGGVDLVSLYGFSAGGGAVVNIIGVLNSELYEAELEKIGIFSADRQKILNAIQKGVVLLDAPLKSIEEILACRPCSQAEEILSENYRKNSMRPIDNLQRLQGLALSVVLFFQDPDRIIFNRDDADFAERLYRYNQRGINEVIIADEGGHSGFHQSLWSAYLKMR